MLMFYCPLYFELSRMLAAVVLSWQIVPNLALLPVTIYREFRLRPKMLCL